MRNKFLSIISFIVIQLGIIGVINYESFSDDLGCRKCHPTLKAIHWDKEAGCLDCHVDPFSDKCEGSQKSAKSRIVHDPDETSSSLNPVGNPLIESDMELLKGNIKKVESKTSETESVEEALEVKIEAKRIPLEIRPGIFFDAWAYGIKGKKPTVPGPTIRVKEGTKVKIHFTNRLSVPASIHPHGVKYTIEHDGAHVAGNPNTIVLPGKSRTYEWDTEGSPGTWVYHTHAFEFGGEKGLDKGLFGPIIVEPKESDSFPDKEFIVFLTSYEIEDKHFEAFNDKSGEAAFFKGDPTAFPGEVFHAKVGKKVRFHLINADSEEMHTFHIHGHRWKDRGSGELIDNVSLGPFTMYVLDIVAGEDVGPGNWMVHCHFGSHMMMGMFGVLAVR